MNKEAVKQTNLEIISVKKGAKHSVAFVYLLMLIVYFPIIFYLRNFDENSIIGYAVPVLFLGLLNLYLWYYLIFVKSSLIKANKILTIILLLCFLIAIAVSGSGFERVLSLMAILMSLMLFHSYPLRSFERNTLYKALIIATILVLADNLIDANINTNTSGFIISMLFCVSIVRFSYKKDAFSLICAVCCVALQMVFVSRTSMLGSFAFLLLLLLFRARKKTFSYKIVFTVFIVIAIMGVIFAWFYSEILYSSIGRGKIVFFGKDLFTGRENIWHFTLESIRKNFWFGAGSHVNEELIESGYDKIYSNVHNQSIGLLASFGVIAFIVFYFTLAYVFAILYAKNKLCSRIPAIFIAVICLMSYLETYFFVQLQWVAIIIAYGQIFNYGNKRIR